MHRTLNRWEASKSSPAISKNKELQQAWNKLSWDRWHYGLFPHKFTSKFGQRHIEFFTFTDSIELGVAPDNAFFAVWPRGSGKTTVSESETVRLAALGKRRFILYVRSTQTKANESIQEISKMLEDENFARIYPDLSQRQLSKYGHSRGYNATMLQTQAGVTWLGLGFDAAVRGVKVGSLRPDLIVFDDIDDRTDSPLAIEKKTNVITNDILPAGSQNVAIIGIQNLMHEASIFNTIVEGKADFLYNRVVSGPYPAIEKIAYEQKPEGGYKITSGQATWNGQDLETCQRQINTWGLTSFLREAQHEVQNTDGGLFSHLEYRHEDYDKLPELIDGCVWVDPAITSTDKSDSMGIQADALGIDDKIYRMYSWEQITTPLDALKRAILKAVELKLDRVGVETDQGGDLWEDEYYLALNGLIEDEDYPHITDILDCPAFESNKAGAGYGPKIHRWNLMLADYERGNLIHVIGTHTTLEKALGRVPKHKPFDLVDAAFWAWDDLANGGIFIGQIEQ